MVTGWRRRLASQRPDAFTTWANVVAALVSRLPTSATLGLAAVRVDGVEFVPMTPVEALERLGPGDAALGRLDVLPTLDGVDDGLWALGVLAARGAAAGR